MNKYHIIGIATAAVTVCTTTAILIASHVSKRNKLTDEVFEMRDELKAKCDIIKDTQEEIPSEITCPADQKFISVADKGMDFVNFTMPLYMRLEEIVPTLSIEELKAHIGGFQTALTNADMHIAAINAAREDMVTSRKEARNIH